jgi:hypothetical protein
MQAAACPAETGSPTEIYTRVFQAMKPQSSLPQIQVEFRRYANASAKIQFTSGILRVQIADTLARAPHDVHQALAEILLAKLFRRKPPTESHRHYRRYLNRPEVRRDLDRVRSQRSRRKQIEDPKGQHHDLVALFEELNVAYFFGLMARPALGWSRQVSRTLLGHYDPSHHTIVINRMLDRADVPTLAVAYVLYHEMLHLRHPAEHRGVRRCVHTRAFKDEEKRFPRLREAKLLLRHLV